MSRTIERIFQPSGSKSCLMDMKELGRSLKKSSKGAQTFAPKRIREVRSIYGCVTVIFGSNLHKTHKSPFFFIWSKYTVEILWSYFHPNRKHDQLCVVSAGLTGHHYPSSPSPIHVPVPGLDFPPGCFSYCDSFPKTNPPRRPDSSFFSHTNLRDNRPNQNTEPDTLASRLSRRDE